MAKKRVGQSVKQTITVDRAADTVVLHFAQQPGLEAFVVGAREWFGSQPQQLSLVGDDADRSDEKRAFDQEAHRWRASGMVVPAGEIEVLYYAPHHDEVPKRAKRPSSPALGKRYSSGVGVERRAITSFVLRVAAEGQETARGVALQHIEKTHFAEVEFRGENAGDLVDVRAAVSRLSPTVEATFDVLLAHALRNGPEADGHYFVDIDGILDAQGISKKRGSDGYKSGHRPDDRARIVNDARTLDQSFVASAPLTYRGRRVREWERVVAIQSYYTPDDGEVANLESVEPKDVLAVRFNFGPWFAKFRAQHETTKFSVPRRLLELHAVAQKPAQDIGRHFFQAAAEADGDGRIFRSVRELIEALGWKPRPNSPKELRDRLEKALALLVSERIITSWSYEQDPDELGRTGWLEMWLGFTLWVRLG